jgi:hypothetical protein
MRRLVLWFVLAFVAVSPAAAYAQATEVPPAPLTENPSAKREGFRPSGFWTNPRPAKGGAYRWRMMAVGGVLLAGTGYLMLRLVRRASAERAARKS